MKKNLFIIALLLVAALVLGACQAEAPTPETIIQTVVVEKEGQTIVETVEVEVEVEKEVIVTEVVEVEKEVMVTEEVADRYGGWLDTFVIVEEPNQEAGVARLQAGDLDVFAQTISDANLFATVQADPNLEYATSFGSYNDLTINNGGDENCVFNSGKFNPFCDMQMREALNWLIDRDYISQEIFGGLAAPRYTPVSGKFADAARYAPILRQIQTKYAPNADAAKAIINERMAAYGAELVDGKWNFGGEPVELRFLIRTEDKRTDIGDYISNLLEDAGFTVFRDYKTSGEASPIWFGTIPSDGEWNLYTGGWVSTAISRDDGSNFAFFHSPIAGWNVHSEMDPTPEYAECQDTLWNNTFANFEERDAAFEVCLNASMVEAFRLFLVDQSSFAPFNANVSVGGDLAGSISGSNLLAPTIRFDDQVGGSLTMAMQSILTNPYNPIFGSNWVYDRAIQRSVGEGATVPNPYTGLALPNRIERAELVAKEGLPINKTLDWVTLEFAPEIEVPADAWIDWDAENQVFVTVGEAYTQTLTADRKSTVYYPADLWDSVKWHDGSSISMGDFVIGMIMTWDNGKEASAIFDESAVANLESFQSVFKGVRVVSTDPLVIETWYDGYALDAESNVSTWWPYYSYGQASWPMLSVGIRAETEGRLAFSEAKGVANEVEWMSYVGGPSLEILAEYLALSADEDYIPYAPTMGQYVTAEEAAARWDNYADFYALYGHFWVNTGVYRIQRVFPVAGTITLEHFPDHPDMASKWSIFSAPPLPVGEIDGPGRVTQGEEAEFTAYVNLGDAPYPSEDMQSVAYLLFDATNALAAQGEAELSEEGVYVVTLDADVTSALEAGSAKIEFVFSSKQVALPAFAAFEFVVAP
jgi:peptide/nickel transport system substrate-binding protein